MAKVEFLEPGQEPMTLNRDKRGQRGHRRGSMEKADLIKIIIFGALFLLCVWYGLTWVFGGGKIGEAKAEAKAEEPAIVRTVAPLPTLPPQVLGNTPTPVLEPAQLAATATFQAMLSRPAAVDPASSPYLVGVVTYETGCPLSNLGFTTAGANGTPYYLYLSSMLDRDPFMQMVQLKGYIQEFKECQYPVLMVQELFWLSGTATPAPVVISGTATVTAAWGSLAAYGLPTPDKTQPGAYDASKDPTSPYYAGPPPVITPTLAPPLPTSTPYIPPPRVDPPAPVSSGGGSISIPTATKTPTPTPTPAKITLSGPVVAVGGCSVSNLAVNAGVPYFLIFEGAQLPAGDPTQYQALVIGLSDKACGGMAIRAQQIQWTAIPTATPTHPPAPATSTPTATATATQVPPTATPTETPTATATAPVSPIATPTEESTDVAVQP